MRWTIHDPHLNTTWTFEVNPQSQRFSETSPAISSMSTTAPTGKRIVYQGKKEPATLEVDGFVRTLTTLHQLRELSRIRRRTVITDDLGRTFTGYIAELTFQRIRNARQPGRHAFSMRFLVESRTSPPASLEWGQEAGTWGTTLAKW